MEKKKRLLVVGGGAAGFFCAVNAARINRSLEVIIVEKTNKILSKVKISGGGRCNVTHACFSIPEMSTNYPRGGNLLKKCFHQFFTSDIIEWFKERGVVLKTEEDGRMFPVTDSSHTVIDCLVREMNKYGVELRLNKEVIALTLENNYWNVSFKNHEFLQVDFVCIACGGYAKSAMFEWLRTLGHSTEDPVPSLFTFNIQHAAGLKQLMGISVPFVKIRLPGLGLEERGPILITHWGLSGPVVLKLSAWGARKLHQKNYEFSLVVNWIPQITHIQLRETFRQLRFESGGQHIYNKNPFGLPQRLWQYILQQSIIDGKRWSDLPAGEQNKLEQNLLAQEFFVKGKTTFKEEFVTSGGIRLSEIDANTMESKLVPNFYFAGEIMDADGITGGFNFQHAWTTAWIAANSIASKV